MSDDFAGSLVNPTTNGSQGGFAGSPVNPTTNSAFAGSPVARPSGATGLGQIGQTIGDLFHSGPATHDPNSLESGIMGVADSAPIKGITGAYQQAVTNGLFMQPTRAVMEGLGVGEDKLRAAYPGQTDNWYQQHLHEMYSNAVTSARQNAQQQIQQNPYPGHQVGNFLAGAVAEPENLLMGGAGVGQTVATRIATAAAMNAGIAGVSDAAAQGMDMLEGQKKSFDITQNLTQAGTGALLGGAMHGAAEAAPVVSDFVKSLFKNRGLDTTPGATPGNNISPTTGDSPTMFVDDQAQLKNLLHTGSVDDIKNFLATKQGPKPSYQDVNNLVQFRDSLPDQFKGQENFGPALDSHINDAQTQAINEHIATQTQGWKNAPKFEVIKDASDIQDPQIRQQAMAEDTNGDALGFLGNDGVVRVFGSRISDPETASALIYHEGLGHYGLQQQFGDKLDSTLQSMLDRNVSQFSKDTDAWMSKNPEAYGGDRLRAAEEVLAERSQNGQLPSSWQNAVGASVRQFGRKMGLKLAYSDGEINHILAMSHDAVVNGNGRNVTANGFRGTDQRDANGNKYMFTGKKATGFDPNDRTTFTANDGQQRNEISDLRTSLRPMSDESVHKLGDVLDHPELYANYPELRDLPVVQTKLDGIDGAYSPKTKAMFIDNEAPNKLSTVLHETQHAIQDIEQYPGMLSSPSTKNLSMEDYLNHPLEKEAFATEDRLSMGMVSRISEPTKFMRKTQMAADQDYKAKDLEGIYKSLDENYKPTTVSFNEVRRGALDAGFKPSQIRDLSETNPGDLSVRLHRMQAAANMADMKINALNDKLDTPEWSMAHQQSYIQTLADRNYLIARIKGEKSEIARALNVAKMASSYTNKTMQEVAELMKDHESGLGNLADNPDTFLKFARQVKQLMTQGNSAGAHVLMAGVNKPYWEQYLSSFHFNAMLSALSTHVKAPLDMMTGISHNVIDHALAVPIGKMYNIAERLTGSTVKPGTSAAEVAGRIWGPLRSVFAHEVYVKTLHAARIGEGSAVLPSGQSIMTNPSSSYGASGNPRIGILSKPTDLIVAQDTFFRSHAISQELYGLGARQAIADFKTSGVKNPSLDDIMTAGAVNAHNPTPTMLEQARLAGEKSLLLNPNKLTGWLDKARAYKPGMTIPERFGAFAAQNLAPFMRVASNSLMTRTIERSPLPLLAPSTWRNIAAGGPEAHLAISKMIYGTIKIGLLWGAADTAKNVLTGKGPDNPAKSKELEASGWRPDAVHENGQYNTGGTLNMSLNPFDTHNATAQMVKDMRTAWEEGTSKNLGAGWLNQAGVGLKMALGSVLHDFEAASWIHDVAPALSAADARGGDAGQQLASFAGQEAKTFVPSLSNQINRKFIDPYQRDTHPDTSGDFSGEIINNIKSAVPGLSKTLPMRYSVYGSPLQTGASLTGVHTIIPGVSGNGVAETQDPAERELARLGSLVSSALITPVQKTIQIDGEKKQLTTTQFEEYQHLAGRAIVETVRSEINTPAWQQMSDQDKVMEVRNIQTDMKKAAREHLYGQQ